MRLSTLICAHRPRGRSLCKLSTARPAAPTYGSTSTSTWIRLSPLKLFFEPSHRASRATVSPTMVLQSAILNKDTVPSHQRLLATITELPSPQPIRRSNNHRRTLLILPLSLAKLTRPRYSSCSPRFRLPKGGYLVQRLMSLKAALLKWVRLTSKLSSATSVAILQERRSKRHRRHTAVLTEDNRRLTALLVNRAPLTRQRRCRISWRTWLGIDSEVSIIAR